MEIKLCFKFNPRLFSYSVFSQCSNYSKYVDRAKSGKSNFENDFRQNHIETSTFQKFILGIGSGLMSIANPRRGDMVAVMGESTGAHAFKYIQSKMQESEEGRKILEDKPRISSTVVNLEKLKQMPEGTLGKAYSNFLERYKYSPDERLAVRFVDDLELAYVAQRYREAHDLFHTILDMPTNMLGEVTVKWVEAIQTRLPMCVTGALFGPLRLAPKLTRTYSTRPLVVMDPEVSEKLKGGMQHKHHPGRMTIKRVLLPAYVEKAIISVLKENKALYLVEEAEKMKLFFYRRLIPKEGIDRENMLNRYKAGVELSLQKNTDKTKDQLNFILALKMKRYEQYLDALANPIVFDAKNSRLYLISRSSYEYASLVNIFNEISLKDPGFRPKTIFDFGSGVGTVIWAVSKVWPSPITEYFTVDTSPDMNELAFSVSELIKDKLAVRHFHQQKNVPTEGAEFDIVVSAFSLSHLNSYEDRVAKIDMLWKHTAKYFVIVENGTRDGFQIVNEARNLILGKKIGFSFKCHIVAPCPHDFVCPKSALGKSVCHFLACYKELQTGKEEKYDGTPYSFVVFMKGSRAPCDKQWPRILSEPIPGKKKLTCTLCTSEGKLENIVFTKFKHGAELYCCARKSCWGDCLPAQITQNIENEESQ